MKTVFQLAIETGVSVQKIYRLLNSVKQKTDICLTEKIKGTLYLTAFGEAEIKARLSDVKQVLNSVKQSETEEVVYLREQNKALQEELATERAHSREQADKLSNLATQLTELTRNNQILLGAEQTRANQTLLVNDENQERLSLKNRVRILFMGR